MRKKPINPATKSFQALRIYVNDELEEILAGLYQGFRLLKDNGIIICLTFHSLEDQMVKDFAKPMNRKYKSILPAREEILSNRRSRSAK